jgi:hypothetical protein
VGPRVAEMGGLVVGLAAMHGADEGDDAVGGEELVLQHLRDAAPVGQEAGLDDGMEAALAEDDGDLVREAFEAGGGAGDEDARGSHKGLCRVRIHGAGVRNFVLLLARGDALLRLVTGGKRSSGAPVDGGLKGELGRVVSIA